LQWHLGFFKYDYTPTKRGFDSFLGYWLGAGDYWDHSESEPDGWGLDLRNNTKVYIGMEHRWNKLLLKKIVLSVWTYFTLYDII